MFVYDILLEEYLTPKTELTHQELLDMEEDQIVSEFQVLMSIHKFIDFISYIKS